MLMNEQSNLSFDDAQIFCIKYKNVKQLKELYFVTYFCVCLIVQR